MHAHPIHPSRSIRPFAALLAILIPLSLITVARSGLAAAQGDATGQLLAEVQAFRAARGLPPWTVDPALAFAAQSHANWVAATGQFGHTGEGGSTPQDRATAAGYSGTVAENYVYGYELSPAGAVQWWANSPIHYQTLTSSAQHVGIGYARIGRNNLYVLVAGRPRSRPRPSGGGNEADEPAGPLVVPITLATPNSDGSIVHVVQQGQTAWAIAARYGVDLEEMLRINNLKRPVVLMPGDEVIVRLGAGQQPPPTPTPPTEHVIQDGETVWEVAVLNGLTVDQLLGFNGLTRDDVIVPGMTLRLIPPEGVEDATDATPVPEAQEAAGAESAPPAAPVTQSEEATPAPTPTATVPLMPTITPVPTIIPLPALVDTATPTASPSPTHTPEPTVILPSGTPAARATLDATPQTAPPLDTESGDGGMDPMLVVSLGVLGAIWLIVGGAMVANYVTNRRD